MSHLENNTETCESGPDVRNFSQGDSKLPPPRRSTNSDEGNGMPEKYVRPPPPPPPPKPQKIRAEAAKLDEQPLRQPPRPQPPPPPPRTDKSQEKPQERLEEREFSLNGTASMGFPYRRDVKTNPMDPASSPARTDTERIRVSPNRALNYGSMERSRRGEHRNPHFERRLSYGYGQPSVVHGDQTDGRIQYNSPHRIAGTGSLERGKNFGYADRKMYGYSSVEREKFPNQNYSPAKTNEHQNQGLDKCEYGGARTNHSPSAARRDGGSPNKMGMPNYGSSPQHYKSGSYGSDGSNYNYSESPSKSDRTNYAPRYSPSKTDSLNRTSYYSHAVRMENQTDESISVPNVRRSSYDFDSFSTKGENAVRHVGYGSQGKPVLPDFGGDRRRLSQPPPGTAGVPPPFYHPPPPPGKFFFYSQNKFRVGDLESRLSSGSNAHARNRLMHYSEMRSITPASIYHN